MEVLEGILLLLILLFFLLLIPALTLWNIAAFVRCLTGLEEWRRDRELELGALVGILTLFGQTPDALIRAWTETADWTFSQKIPPPNVWMDEHYLCTVAAGGHRRVVKPLRMGRRHGHTVVVNRQLCVANAFEQLLEERTPRLHRAVRGIYDRTGYPIARHIRSPYAADLIYCLMKPLEWLFLLVLYTADARPEDRIAVQYPHAALPGAEGRAVT